MTTILVDLEGTLTDHTDRLRVLQATTQMDPRDRTAWKTYYQGLINDEPHEDVLRFVRMFIQVGDRPLVYSTRFINKYNQEEEWLRGHELWEHVDLIQRLPQEPKIKGPDLVCEWVNRYKPSMILDDRVEVRELIRSNHPQVIAIGPGDPLPKPTA